MLRFSASIAVEFRTDRTTPATSITVPLRARPKRHAITSLVLCFAQMEMCGSLDVSWSPYSGTHVTVFRKHDGPLSSGEYYDHHEYASSLRRILHISKNIVQQTSAAQRHIDLQPRTWQQHVGLRRVICGPDAGP